MFYPIGDVKWIRGQVLPIPVHQKIIVMTVLVQGIDENEALLRPRWRCSGGKEKPSGIHYIPL
jgi:hypothetical protein